MMPLDAMPEWAAYLVRGLVLCALMVFSAIILGRAGRNPYWAVLVVIPYGLLVGLWIFAFCGWPRRDARAVTDRKA